MGMFNSGEEYVEFLVKTLLDSGLLTEEAFLMAFSDSPATQVLEVHIENNTIVVDGAVFTFDEWNKLAKVASRQGRQTR